MNARLSYLLAEAEARLLEAEQDDLADLVASYLDSHGAAPFTAEELAHLDRLVAEPFVEADPAEVAAIFARRRG